MAENKLLLIEPKVIESVIKELGKLNDEESKQRVLSYINNAFNYNQKEVTANDEKHSVNSKESNPIKLWVSKDPKTNYEKLTLIVFYLEKIIGKEEVSRGEIEKSWKDDFKQTLPGKQVITNSLKDTVRKYQYLLTGSKKGLYRLSNRGDELSKGLPNPDEKYKGQAKKIRSISKKKIKK